MALATINEEYEREHNNSLTNRSIWDQMSYIPPRGPCQQTSTIVGSLCKCLRFMIRPDTAPTSFSCDGCGHHASFHELRNKSEEAIRARWTKEDGSFDREAYEADEEVQEVLAKRKRLGYGGGVSSGAQNRSYGMPEKAARSLVEGGGSGRAEKKRKSVNKTFEDFVG